VDALIAVILAFRFRPWLGAVFFLNPISIIITGYHNQFDNLAILFGLIALILYERWESKRQMKTLILTTALLGVSLVVKHVFFLLPVWLAFRERKWISRIVIVLIPYAIFILAFLPYVARGFHGILANVFLYTSYSPASLWSMLSLGRVHLNHEIVVLFLAALLGVGYFTCKKSPMAQFVLYGAALVALSPAVVNQYYVIPLLFIIILPNLYGVTALVITAMLLVLHYDGLGLAHHMPNVQLDLFIRIGPYLYILTLLTSIFVVLRRGKNVLPKNNWHPERGKFS
jgi:hypothetical protein